MKKRSPLKRRGIVITLFVIAMLFASLSGGMAYAEDNMDCQHLEGSNVGYHNYSRWTTPVYSYLTTKDGGYMRVQGNVSDQGIVVTYYDADFKLISRRTITGELPLFGAFYETTDNYFIVTGQTNTEEDNNKEVYRITKYDKNWNKLGSCGLKGANTTVPFDAGSCRMHHSGNYLIIRTSHKKYKSSDGYNHQANVTIQVNISNMTITDSYYDTMNTNYGYVSHSFNQFVKIENNKIIAVDHGDASPRSICLMEYPTDISNGTFFPTYSNPVRTTNVLSFQGNTGDNTTGASVGGFEISGTSYLIAGNSVVQDNQNTSRSTRNIFVASVNKSSKNVQINWLTDYSEGETSCSTPFMVKLPSNEYMVMWARSGNVYYTRVNGSGQQVSQIYSMTGALSDCVPLVYDNKLIWYTWNNSKEVFYQIPLNDLSNPTSSETVYDHDYEHIKTENGLATLRCKKCGSEKVGKVPTSFYLFWSKTKYGNYSTYFPSCDIDDTPYYTFNYYEYSAEADITLNDMVLESDNPTNCIIDTDEKKLTFLEAGTYTFTAYPKYNPTATKKHKIIVTKPLQSVSLICDNTSPQKYGKALKFTSTPDGGKGNLSYNYTVTASNGTVVKTQSSSNEELNWTPGSVGSYQIKVKVADSYDGKEVEDSVSFVISKDDLKIKGGKTITANSITYGDRVSQIALNNASFVSDTTGTDVAGNIVFDQPNQVLDAGNHTIAWRFVPDNSNYNEFAGSTQVAVQKKTPAINTDPAAGPKIYRPSLTLGSVPLINGTAEVPGSWTWVDSNQKLTVPGGSYAYRFTPDDTTNYNTVIGNLDVTVIKAIPHLKDLYAEDITYGQTLSDSAIDFNAQYSVTDETVVGGAIAWADGSVKPNVNDSNNTEYDVMFTPSDTDNYTQVRAKVKLIVNKADKPDKMPEDRYEVPYSTKALTNGILSDASGWSFDESDIDTQLDVGEEKEFTASYTASDSFNFNNTTKKVTVLRKECPHDGEKELRNKVAATCVDKGYTGDEYCLICEAETEHGSETEIDSNNHEHTSILPGVEATYDSDGLTDGEKCDSCGTVIREQQTIPKLVKNEPQDPAPQNTDPTAGLSSSEKAVVKDISAKLGVTPEQAVKINEYAKQNGISKDTLLINDASVTKGNTDADMKGSSFGQLQAFAKKNTKNAITLKWRKEAKADGYIIYGNKCGKKNKMKKLKTFTSNSKLTFTQKKLKKGTYYKYIVIAYKNIGGKQVTINASPTIHSITKGGKFGVAKSVAVTKVGNKKGTSAKLKKGKTAKIVAKEVRADKKIKNHRKLAYETSNSKVASVSKKGVIKAVGKGKCYVYVYAQNGISKKLKITVY